MSELLNKEAFYDDSSSYLALGHNAGPIDKVRENPLLADTSWNERENARREADLKARGEQLPPAVADDGSIVDRDFQEQLVAEFTIIERTRRDLSEPEQRKLARDRVSARQRQSPRNVGAYDEVGAEIAFVSVQEPDIPLIERIKIARERVASRPVPEPTDDSGGQKASWGEEGRQEASAASLMAKTRIHSGGGRGNAVKFRTERGVIVGQDQLMGAKSSGGGGSKSGKKSGKGGGSKKWICPNCHLEKCEHRPKQSGKGRASKEGEARSKHSSIRLSVYTLSQIEASGLGTSDWFACSAIAYCERRMLDEVIAEWKSRSK